MRVLFTRFVLRLQEKYKQIYVAEDIQERAPFIPMHQEQSGKLSLSLLRKEYWSSECQPSKLKSPAKSPAAAPPEAEAQLGALNVELALSCEEPASISTQA